MSGAFAQDAPHYYAAGVNVLPIVPGTKQPPAGVAWRRWQAVRQTGDELGQLVEAHPTADVALVCGGPGCLVDVETDGEQGKHALRELRLPVPVTACFSSPRGLHRLYRAASPVASRVALRPGLDVLAARRYVVAPSSAGRVWVTPGGVDAAAPLPEAWAEVLLRQASCRCVPDALRVAEVAGAEEGRRNMTLTRLVGRWLTQGVREADVFTRAQQFGERCWPPLQAREVQKVVASVLRARASGRSPERMALLTGRASGLSPTHLLVFVALETHRGELGVSVGKEFAAPVREIAGRTGQSPSTVSEAFHRIQQTGLLSLREGRDPTGRPVTLVVLTCYRSLGEHKHL